MSFGERLRAWRVAQGLSQKALAGLLKVDQSTVSLIEKKGQEPKASVLERIREISAGDVTWSNEPAPMAPTGTDDAPAAK